MTPTPLEKAARAAVHAAHVFYGGEADASMVWASLDDDAKAVRMAEIRAVLLFLREPDEGMVEAGYGEEVWGSPAPVFTAMIDHILRGGETG